LHHFELLLLNVLMIVFPIFLYQFFLDRVKVSISRIRKIIATLAAASILFCMAFPYDVMDGYIFDLRAVPLILSYCYGGYATGLFATAAFVIGRWLIGGQGFYVSVGAFAIALIPVLLVVPKWNRFKRSTQRLLGVLFVSVFCGVVYVIGHLVSPSLSTEFARTIFNSWLVNTFAMLLAIHLIDELLASARIRIEMLRTEKLHVVSELAASIAHEVRNPMSAARGFSQLLAESSNLTDRQLRYLQMIQSELDRAQNIINEYLSFARPQVDDVEELNLREEIQRVIGIISPYAALRGVTLDFQECQEDIRVMANRGKLVQALVNIVKNAVEANPADGMVHIKAMSKGHYAAVQILDTGVGMTSEQLNNLGSPFYSTKSNGTGLGLMTTYRIIQAMNGTISVDSELGKGTVFVVTLPRSS
jgi:two-component system sporulation sensor kinase B